MGSEAVSEIPGGGLSVDPDEMETNRLYSGVLDGVPIYAVKRNEGTVDFYYGGLPGLDERATPTEEEADDG